MKPTKQIHVVLVTIVCVFSVRQAVAVDKLIELIPDQAMGAVYIQRPQRAFPPNLIEPLFEALTESKTEAARLVEAVKRIPGPVLIGTMTPPPGSEEIPDIFVAMEQTGPHVDWGALVEKTFLPVVKASGDLPPDHTFKVEKGKTGSRILLMPKGETVFAYAVKGKIAFGATKPQLALRWARGEWPQRRWVDMPGVRKMISRLPKTVSVRAFINPVPLLKQIEKPKPNSYDELALKILVPEDIRAAAVDLTWERSTLSARVTVALADECQGIARILARPTNSTRVLGVFPEDFLALGRIGWGRASDLVDGAYAICDRFDETISAEYREEMAEFREETGVDWDTGILGNLVGEAAFGVRVDFTSKNPVGWAVVFPLADVAQFREQFDKLIAHFDLRFDDTDEDGVLVRKTVVRDIAFRDDIQLPAATTMLSSGVYLAIEHGLLITGSNTRIVADVAKQAVGDTGSSDKRAEPAGANLRACYEALGDPNHLAVMLDIEQLRKRVPILPIAVGPKWAPLLAEGTAGFAVTVEEHVASIDFRWSLKSHGSRDRKTGPPQIAGPDGSEAMMMLVRSLTESIIAARRQARRVVSMSNMRGISQALYIYAARHKGAFPESLEGLVRAAPDTVSLRQLTSPYDGRGPKSIDEVERKSYLIYRPGLTTHSNPSEVLMAEREVMGRGGANFLFVDSHVEFVPEPRASELLELMAVGADEIRR